MKPIRKGRRRLGQYGNGNPRGVSPWEHAKTVGGAERHVDDRHRGPRTLQSNSSRPQSRATAAGPQRWKEKPQKYHLTATESSRKQQCNPGQNRGGPKHWTSVVSIENAQVVFVEVEVEIEFRTAEVHAPPKNPKERTGLGEAFGGDEAKNFILRESMKLLLRSRSGRDVAFLCLGWVSVCSCGEKNLINLFGEECLKLLLRDPKSIMDRLKGRRGGSSAGVFR